MTCDRGRSLGISPIESGFYPSPQKNPTKEEGQTQRLPWKNHFSMNLNRLKSRSKGLITAAKNHFRKFRLRFRHRNLFILIFEILPEINHLRRLV